MQNTSTAAADINVDDSGHYEHDQSNECTAEVGARQDNRTMTRADRDDENYTNRDDNTDWCR